MVWYGMVWYGMVWFGMVWYGLVWYGMVEGMALITALLCPDAGRPNLMLGPTWLKARFENSCSQVPNLIFNGQDQIESLKSQL